MSVTAKIRGMLKSSEKKQIELGNYFGMMKQTMQNKMARDSWSASDLIKVADFLGAKLAFIFPDGSQTVLTMDDLREKAEEKP